MTFDDLLTKRIHEVFVEYGSLGKFFEAVKKAPTQEPTKHRRIKNLYLDLDAFADRWPAEREWVAKVKAMIVEETGVEP